MNNSSIWTEKYRPSTFENFVGQKEIVRRVKALVETKNIPHMMFAGPAGLGKTTLAIIVAKILHQSSWRQNFLETNASDERGIEVVRQKVKDFAKTMAIEANSPKIILLDEADALTKEAQQALRRTMETYSNSCRFIISCNYQNKLIDPIKSRCAIFRFKPLSREEIGEIIQKVANNEGLKIDSKAVSILYEQSGGDVRQIYNTLQSCSAISKNVDEDLLNSFVSKAEASEIKDVVSLALSKNFLEARNKMLSTILNNGLSGLDVVKQIQREVLESQINDNKKLDIIEKCGEIEFRLVEGANDFIQLEALLAFMANN